MDLKDLGRRAKASPMYSEIPGILGLPDEHRRTFRLTLERLPSEPGKAPRWRKRWTQEGGPRLRCEPDASAMLPDLSDTATTWALLSCLPYSVLDVAVYMRGGNWIVDVCENGEMRGKGRAPTQGEALVLAMEAL